MRHEDSKMRELVSGFGEVWSSQILCALLNQNTEGRRFCFLNARRVLIVDDPPEGEVGTNWLLGVAEKISRGLLCFFVQTEKSTIRKEGMSS